MANYPFDPHRPFDEVAREIRREHASHRSHRRSSPRRGSIADDRRKTRLKWTIVIVVCFVAAIALGLLLPTL
ncbi:MAG TPA: hypothetical protein VK989_03605 [Polyangia bacterium]|nr:hypothetical protein [Polyangia bacterium]